MALGHKFRNFGSEEGRIGEGFTINSPFRAGAVFVRRDNRSRHGRVSRNIFALGFAESDDANRRHLGHVGVHIESGNHVREVLIPVFKAIAFNNRIGRSLSGSTIGNALGINHVIENEELHVELVHGALGFESRQLSNRKFVTGMEFNFAIQPGIASERVAGRRIIRDNNRRIHRDRVTLSGVNRNEADFSHRSQESVNFQIGLHVREFLVPTVKAEAFDNRIGRSLSVSIESNGLFVVGCALDIERHSEGLGNLFELSSVSCSVNSGSERLVPASELVGCRIRFEVSRNFRFIFFVVVERDGAPFEELLVQYNTIVGNEGDFEHFVQHGIVGHATSIELILGLLGGEDVTMIVLPALEGSAGDRRIGHGDFGNLALDGRCFESNMTLNNERNLVVALAASEVKHRIVTRFIQPHEGIVNLAVLSIQDINKTIIGIHVGSRLAHDSRNRRMGALRANSARILKDLRVVIAVFNFRKIIMFGIFVFNLTDNTTHDITGNGVSRAEGVQHLSRVVTGSVATIIIEIAITDNTTSNTRNPVCTRSCNRAIVTAVVDGTVLVVTDNTTGICRTCHRTEVLANSNTARNVRDIRFNRSIMGVTDNTASSFAGYSTIVDAIADCARVRAGNTTSHIRTRYRGMVFATSHRAVTTVTTGNTTGTAKFIGILRRIHLHRCCRLGIFNDTIVQANDGTGILRLGRHCGIINSDVLDNALLANHAKEAGVRIIVPKTGIFSIM